MTTPYIYSPLPSDAEDVRLLTIEPGNETDDIAVTLQHFPLVASAEQYEALSYVWGPTVNSVTIDVRGFPPGGHNTLSVTRNVAVALRHLRSPSVRRTLWVDAICIDQKNARERSEQVLRMADIFRMASRVVIWLGPESSDSDLAIRLLAHQGLMAQFDPERFSLTPTLLGEPGPHWADVKEPLPYGETELRAIEGLLYRQWFERLWVVQEVLVNPHALVVCGTSETTWQLLFRAILSLAFKGAFLGSEAGQQRLSSIMGAFFTTQHRNLAILVHHTRNMVCLDPRDRIYAVLGIAGDARNIKPDYSLTTMQVYREYARAQIRSHSLEFLRYCELGSRELAGPTWVPDWSSPRETQPTWGTRAASFAWAPVIERPGEDTIQVAATRVGTLCKVDGMFIPSSGDASLIAARITTLAPARVETLPYPTGCSLLGAFCGTLVAQDLKTARENRAYLPNLRECVEAVRSCLRWEDGASACSGESLKYLGNVHLATKCRGLVAADNGYIGLAPASAHEGDVVYAVLSCASLIVLRPVEGSAGRFQVIGECFLYGMNNGEALLGSLPAHFQVECHFYPEAGEWCNAYRNVKTDEVSLEDPRLSALGIHPGFAANSLPRRVSSEILEKAGVGISHIELV